MANFVAVTPGTGADIEAYALNDGVETVFRQACVIGDDTTFAAKAKVNNSEPGASDYGLTTRQARVGASLYHVVTAASTNAANIKASAGRVLGWSVFNDANYPVYVKFYNTASSPTVGTGVVYTIGAQAGVEVHFDSDDGLAFSTGIGISITKGIADSDATAVAASDAVVNVHYK